MLRDEVVAAAAEEEEEVLGAALVEAAEKDDDETLLEVVVVFEFCTSRPRASLNIRVPRLNASGSCFCPRPTSKVSQMSAFRLLLPLYSEAEVSRNSRKVGDRAAGG